MSDVKKRVKFAEKKMQCVLITTGVDDASFLYASDALLAQTLCSIEELWQSVTFNFPSMKPCAAYQKRSGHIQFCHTKTMRKCKMHTIHQSFIGEKNTVYNIYTVQQFDWADDDYETIIGFLECSLFVRRISYTTLTRNGIEYIAVPIEEMLVPQHTRCKLIQLNCEVGVNVSYKASFGCRIRRSYLFPKCLLINFQPLHPSKIWTIIRLDSQGSIHSRYYDCTFGKTASLPQSVVNALTALKHEYKEKRSIDGVANFSTLQGNANFRYTIYTFRMFYVAMILQQLHEIADDDKLAQTWPRGFRPRMTMT